MDIDVRINGDLTRLDVEPRRTLADVLRDDCGLTGTHLGCEHGVCGACTVLVNDEPVRACLMLAVQSDGATVTTVEGLQGTDGSLHPLQEAFMEHHALQCGFCTPGILMTALHLLRSPRSLDRRTIRDELSGHICRCTGYQSIVDAVEAVASQRQCDPSNHGLSMASRVSRDTRRADDDQQHRAGIERNSPC